MRSIYSGCTRTPVTPDTDWPLISVFYSRSHGDRSQVSPTGVFVSYTCQLSPQSWTHRKTLLGSLHFPFPHSSFSSGSCSVDNSHFSTFRACSLAFQLHGTIMLYLATDLHAVFRKLLSGRELGDLGDHLVSLPFLKNLSPLLPIIKQQKIAASYFIQFFSCL